MILLLAHWAPWIALTISWGDTLMGLGCGILGILVCLVCYKRPDLYDERQLVLTWFFGIILILLGVIHGLNVLSVWQIAYIPVALAKLVGGIATFAMAILALPTMPKSLSQKSPITLEKSNERLMALINEKESALKISRSGSGDLMQMAIDEAKYRAIAEALPQIVWTATPEGERDWYNPRWYEYTGQTAEQAQGWGWQDVVHPDDLENVLSTWKHSLETGEVYETEYRFRTADGVYHWFLGRGVPLRDPSGKIIKWFGTSTDINEQKSISEKLKKVADELQQAFLPAALPLLPGLSFSASYTPASDEAMVGGDWYDSFVLPSGNIAIAIGDVAGHGLDSAVMMGQIRQAIRAVAIEESSPSIVLERVNRLLNLQPEINGMATAIFAILDPVNMELKYANAGHPVPIIVGYHKGQVEQLQNGGVPLGIVLDNVLETRSITLPRGCMCVFYTDGLIEYDRDVISGETKLVSAIRREMLSPTPNPAKSIYNTLLATRKSKDDVAILTVSIPLSPLVSIDADFHATPPSAPLARQTLRRLIAGLNLDEIRSSDILLACGEAVNNAIEHAYVGRQGNFHLSAKVEDHKLHISVSDKGEWRPLREEGRGRGLMLMQACTESMKVEKNEHGGTTVDLIFLITPAQSLLGEEEV